MIFSFLSTSAPAGTTRVSFPFPAPSPAEPEIRAVWAHPGIFGPDPVIAREKMRATFQAWSEAGIDTVIMMIKGTSGHVYWPSKIGELDPAYTKYDFLGTLLEEAARWKIVVHPWFCVFNEGAIVGPVRRHPEWLIRSPEGELIGAVNPALPEARAYELSLMMEVVGAYPVDWIHLDYIRFPSSPREVYFGWDVKTRALFKEYSTVDPVEMKARDSGNMMWDEWIEWNASRVTTFVRELKAALQTVGRPVKISAAVFPTADEAKVLIGQDWAAWLREGLLDMLCPMLYTNHLEFFEKHTRRAIEAAAGRTPVLPGIGIGTSHNQNTPEGMIAQIQIARRLGARGQVFFSAGSLKPEFLEALKAEKTRK